MASWVDITSSAYWEPKVLVDSGHVIPVSPGEAPDGALSTDYTVLNGIFYALSSGIPMLNALSGSVLPDAYLTEVAPGAYPAFAFSGGHWVPSAQTYAGYVVPILKYIGPVIADRTDCRVTLTAPAAAGGATAVFCVAGAWSDVLVIPQPAGFAASGNMQVPLEYSPTFDPVLGGSEVSTLGTGAAYGVVGGVAYPYPNSADVLSTIAAATLNSSGHLVAVPTITKIEVYGTLTSLFWKDLQGCEQS